MSDEIVISILQQGEEIINRNSCSEQDIVFHLIAPLLEAFGWKKIEIHFELGDGRSTPDISLVPDGAGKPILTVEAKAPNKNIPVFLEGESRIINAKEKTRRDDITLQIFRQLLDVKRLDGHHWACLSNGRIFQLFTIKEVEHNLFALFCLYSIRMNGSYGYQNSWKILKKIMCRETYCDNNALLLVNKFERFKSQINSDRIEKAGEVDFDSRDLIDLPRDWETQCRSWGEEISRVRWGLVEPIRVFINEFSSNTMTIDEKISFYGSMRFCHLLIKRVPKSWRFSIIKSKTGNINIQLYPNWVPDVLQKLKGSFLFQISVNGGRPGLIWLRRCQHVLKTEIEGSPLWDFCSIKEYMNSKMPKSALISQNGMVESFIQLISDASLKMCECGLIRWVSR